MNNKIETVLDPQGICEHSEWLTEGCTAVIGYYTDGTPKYKDVHRCKKCYKVKVEKDVL